MTDTYRVFIIKCLKTNKCYISYTNSKNKSYNPLSYLYSIYQDEKLKYIELGKSIDEYGILEHKYTFVKNNLSKDKASEITDKLREKTQDRSLHDNVVKISYFDEELKYLEDEELNDN